jgi:hypothetical protein
MKTTTTILSLVLLAGAWAGCSKKSGATAGPPEKQIIGTDAANEPTPFKLAWLPGKRYSFRIETVIGTDITPPGSPTNRIVVSAISQDYSFSVGAPQNGVQELDMEITAQRFFYQLAEKNYLISDSRQSTDEDAADPISPFLRRLLNQPFKCFVADGALVRTEGLDALTADVENGHPKLKPLVQGVLNENNLKIMFDTLNASQPDAPVKIGDSWPIHLEMDPYGANALIQDGHNTFTNWDMCDNRQCIHTLYQGNFSPKAGGPDGSRQTEIQDGTLSGEAWFDPQLGMLVRSFTVEHLNGTITASDQTLPAQINVTSNFHLLSVQNQ